MSQYIYPDLLILISDLRGQLLLIKRNIIEMFIHAHHRVLRKVHSSKEKLSL
jgi:hypothetical protein